MLPSKHLKPDTESLPSLSAEPSLTPLTLEEQFWLEDYGWNKFKALLVENGLDPHNIKHVTRATRTIRINGDRHGMLLPRLAEELAENIIVRQSSSVQEKKEEEVLRSTPMNEDHVQQAIDSTTKRQPGPQKYARNGEDAVKPDRKSGLSVFVGSDYETPCFVAEPGEQEQKKLYVKMVTNSGNSIFIEYEEDGENEQIEKGTEAGMFTVQDVIDGKVHSVRPLEGFWRVYRLMSNNDGTYCFVSLKRNKKKVIYTKHWKKKIKNRIQDTRDTLQDDDGLSQVPLVTATSSESSGNEGIDRDAEDPLPHENTTQNARFMIEKAIEVVRSEQQKALRNGSVALPRQEHSG